MRRPAPSSDETAPRCRHNNDRWVNRSVRALVVAGAIVVPVGGTIHVKRDVTEGTIFNQRRRRISLTIHTIRSLQMGIGIRHSSPPESLGSRAYICKGHKSMRLGI